MKTEEKTLTGYPSIEKPWLKHYSEQELNMEIPICSLYDYLYSNNIDNLSSYEEYKKAFSLGPREHNVYHVLISNLNKRIRSELAIEMRTPQNNRNISLFEQSFNISDNKERTLGLINEMEIYIAMAIKKFPDEPQWYAFSIYRKIYKICMKNASDVNAWKKNLKSLKKDATRIEILKGEQALCVVAKAEVADIEEYCSKN